MRIEDAKIFLALAEQRNLRRTAERAGLTQSAVTKVLQRLEQEFGLKLAERGPGGLVLTDAGLLLRKRAASLVLSFDNLRKEMTAARSAQSGTVRIGTVPALLDSNVIPLLARSRAQQPALRLQVSVKVSDELIEMVTAGELDLAICFLQDSKDDLRCESLGPQRYHVVVRQGHPLAAPGAASMEALSRADWLLPAPAVAMRRWIEQAFVALGLPEPTTAVQTDTSTASFGALIRSTDLVTALMTPMLQSPVSRDMVELPFQGAQLTQQLGLVFRKTAYLSQATLDMRDAIHYSFR
ncbi:LysR family transcriptional regulator [Xylophilus sp. GW821-FHT01B05]